MHDPPRILIVDDNATNRDILAVRLATQGYDLHQAADGEEALAAAEKLLPDVVLLDVMMPKLNGIEVAAASRATAPSFHPDHPGDRQSRDQGYRHRVRRRADEYLTKPVDQAALVARVRSVLRLKAAHDRADGRPCPMERKPRAARDRTGR